MKNNQEKNKNLSENFKDSNEVYLMDYSVMYYRAMAGFDMSLYKKEIEQERLKDIGE